MPPGQLSRRRETSIPGSGEGSRDKVEALSGAEIRMEAVGGGGNQVCSCWKRDAVGREFAPCPLSTGSLSQRNSYLVGGAGRHVEGGQGVVFHWAQKWHELNCRRMK